MEKPVVSLKKGQVLIEALLALLFAFAFLFLLQMFYWESQKAIQKERLSSKTAKKTAPWFHKGFDEGGSL